MNEITIISLLFIPTLLLFLTSIPKSNLKSRYRFSYAGLTLSTLLGITTMFLIWRNGASDFNLFGHDLSVSLRIDALNSLIYTMIGIIGITVVRFSRNYLDGEKRHTHFISRLALTIGFVQLFVLSGNLTTLFIGWVGTSIGLHQLLLFYPERKKAQLAARKKFLIARLADISLLSAFLLIYRATGTTDLTSIFQQLKATDPNTISSLLEISGLLLVISACLKSVQIPFHGWLLEVMETPTPVSALLHAGLLNAGPFLVLRFSGLLDLTSTATTVLIIVGAMSALFGAISASTQTSVKTALAYSSVAHMGFTLFVSGLGIYSAALLHLVAHSFYKAHAFLSSGSLIEKVQTSGATHYFRQYNWGKIVLAVILSSAIFVATSYMWFDTVSPEFQLLVIAAVIFMGVLSIHINTLDSNNSRRSILFLLVASFLVINFFYGFEHLFSLYLGNEVPGIRSLDWNSMLLLLAIVALFLLTILSQTVLKTSGSPLILQKLNIHFRNGLYLNQLFNRSMNSLSMSPVKQR